MKIIRNLIGGLIGSALLVTLFLLTLLGQVPSEFIWPVVCPAVLALAILLLLGSMSGRDPDFDKNWNRR